MFAKADRFLFHTSPARVWIESSPTARVKTTRVSESSAKTKVVMERKERSVCVCVCVEVHGTGQVCLRTSVFMSVFGAEFCDDLADSAACCGSAFPLSGCSPSSVSPVKKYISQNERLEN